MTRAERTTLFVACAGAFVAALSTSIVAISAPVIARDLGVEPGAISVVLSAYLVAVSACLATAGRLADLLGQKRIYLLGFVFFVSASAMCAAAETLPALVGARIFQGMGAAMLMAVGPALITRVVPPDRRARGLGTQLAVTYLGLTLGPTAGGALAAALGWHAVFVVVACAGVVGGSLALVLLPSDAPPGGAARLRPNLDLPGGISFAAALTALLIALRRGPADGWTSPLVLLLAALAAGALLLFAQNELRAEAPLLPLPLLRQPPFAFGIAGAMLLYVVIFLLSFLLPFHLQDARGMTPAAAGAIMTAQPATMAITAPVSGILADRLGARLPATLGMAILALGMALVAWTAEADAYAVAAALSVVGLGAGLFVAPNNAVIMGAASRDRQGTAAAMAATARNVGMASGIAAAASLGAAIGFRTTLLVASGLAMAGAALGAVRPMRSPDG
jgi:EmrB/QacA subfamily drug resistance transporter